jgi:hypothetical protein
LTVIERRPGRETSYSPCFDLAVAVGAYEDALRKLGLNSGTSAQASRFEVEELGRGINVMKLQNGFTPVISAHGAASASGCDECISRDPAPPQIRGDVAPLATPSRLLNPIQRKLGGAVHFTITDLHGSGFQLQGSGSAHRLPSFPTA